MLRYITILIIFISSGIYSQSERVELLDSSIGDFYTNYYLVIGHTLNGQKVGDWKLFQYSSADTNKFLAASETYENGTLSVLKEFKLDGHTEQNFDNKGRLMSESTYRYGNIVMQTEYKNRKKAISRSYYPNGQVSGEGPEILVKVIAGCDAGMIVFQRVGKWTYYDVNGSELDPQIYELNQNVYKKI